MDRNLVIGGAYKHFKGNIYKVLARAHHTETSAVLVIYQSINTGIVYARPINMFLGEVDHTKYPSISQKYRFEYLGETDNALPENN